MNARADDATVAELDARRVQVIEEVGWGCRVRVFQPTNLAFWVWALLVAWGAFRWFSWLATTSAYYAPSIALAFVVFTLYGALFWWFTHRIDRYASQPGALRTIGFLWGAFAATWALAAPANDALRALYGKLFGQAFSLDWGASFAVPITEEWGKGIGLVLLMTLAPRVVRTPYDGFILGAFIGLGFQLTEDVAYILGGAQSGFGSEQIAMSFQVYVVRTTSGVAGHILFSAIFCAGLLYLLGTRAQPRRTGLGIGLILVAMAIHFVWDAQAAITHAVFSNDDAANVALTILLPGLPILALLIVVRVFKVAVQSERDALRDLLAPEVVRGVVGQEEVDAAAGDRKARRAYRRAGQGRAEHRRREHALEATFDLATELGRAGGRTTDRVELARSEARRLVGAGTSESNS